MKVTLALALLLMCTSSATAMSVGCLDLCHPQPPEEVPPPSIPTIPSVSPPNQLPSAPSPGAPGVPDVPPVVSPPNTLPSLPTLPEPGVPSSPSLPALAACHFLPAAVPVGGGAHEETALPPEVNLMLKDLGRTRAWCERNTQ